MSLRIEEFKILPSLLQEKIENNESVIVRCDVVVPNDITKHKTFKLNMQTCNLKSTIPNLNRWYDVNDSTVFRGNKKRSSKMSTVYECLLNFPINKIVRGIHPTTLMSFNMTHSNVDANTIMTYSWNEQLDSWVSLYDAEVSSYYEATEKIMPEEILICNPSNTSNMVMVEYKRTYCEPSNDKHVEYLYYLTYADSYQESFLKSALSEYHELMNSHSGNKNSSKSVYNYTLLKF